MFRDKYFRELHLYGKVPPTLWCTQGRRDTSFMIDVGIILERICIVALFKAVGEHKINTQLFEMLLLGKVFIVLFAVRTLFLM